MKTINSIIKTFVLSLLIISQVHFAYAQSAASILPPAVTQLFDKNGNPLTAGTVEYYIPGTSSHKTTWKDSGKSVTNTNPVVLDSAGSALMLGDGSYRQVVKDKLGNVIWDQITSSTGTGGGSSTTVGDGQPVGSVQIWAGLIAPAAYAFAYGQEFTRAGFPELFAALTIQQNVSCTLGSPTLSGLSNIEQLPVGAKIESVCLNAGATVVSKTISSVTASANAIITSNSSARFFPYGNGDGSLTFNAPDYRGIYLAGRCNMGGIACTNLTNFYGDSSSLYAPGGGQSRTLTTGNLPPYTPSGTITVSSSFTGLPVGGLQGVGLGPVNSGSGATAWGGGTGASSTNVIPFGTVNSSGGFTGTPAGGSSAAFGVTPPSRTVNYIIKTLPDTNPNSYFGVASIGGMTGVLLCGTGITCAGSTISAINSTVQLDIGTSTISNGSSGRVLFDNAGVLGEYGTTGTGGVVRDTSPIINNISTVTDPTSATRQWISGAHSAVAQLQSGGPFFYLSTITAVPIIFQTNSITRGTVAPTTSDWTFGVAGSSQGTLSLAGSASGATKLTSLAAATGTLNLPSATDTLIGKATVDTLTNKTYDTAGTGNNLSINGVAVTANTGTGAVARAASPTFTNPVVGTQTAGNNTTLAASTAFVQAAVSAGVAGVASLNGQTGNLLSYFPAQGRLTLTSGIPIMGTNVAGATLVYYTPYVGDMVPVYNGSNWVPTVFPEVSQATTDVTKSPTAVAANSCYDEFAWIDTGPTPRVTRGPAWTSLTARSAGTVLTLVNGMYVNSVSITNGPASQRGTYVGTICSNASGTIDWINGSIASGGGQAKYGLWNAYNRVPVTTTVGDSTVNWSYAVANVWRAPNGNATMRVSAVRGFDVDGITAAYSGLAISGASTVAVNGIGVNSTTVFTGTLGLISNTTNLQQSTAQYSGLMGLGYAFVSAIEYNTTTTASFWIGSGGVAYQQTGLTASIWQ